MLRFTFYCECIKIIIQNRREVNTLAKETRLNDSAEIYKPRDEKTERQKLKDMSFKDKITYFNDYYVDKMIALEDKYNLLENNTTSTSLYIIKKKELTL